MSREFRGALVLLGLVLSTGPVMAQQPTQAQASAIRSACRGDYQSVCANVPTGGQAALQCLQQHASQVSSGCQQALAPLSGAQQNQSPMSAPQSAPAASAPLPPLRPMTPREQARLLRADCGNDYQRFCAGVQLGGGRALECLRAHGSQLSSQCRSVLLAASQHR